MAAPGLERHRLALLAAREDVGNPRAGTDWAVFAYEKHHDLKLLDSGAGGPDELAEKFSATSVMYGLCRVRDPGTGAARVVLINWVGEKVPECQRQACAGHLPTIRAFFREASVVLSARRAEEVTQEGLSRALAQLAPAAATPALAKRVSDTQELVGTNYCKTNPALEIRRTGRDSFWAQAEREEEQRKAAERRRAREERRRWERERREQERQEAAERERRLRDTERRIEERRKEQARLEAEERRKEKERWEQQQREYEEATRDRGRCSESLGKAAEAAALVSQRPQNPRDFFRQRERSGSTSGTPAPVPGAGPGARRPFLRYQRSLTESAFIFGRPDPPASPGPPQHGPFRAAPPPSPRRPQPPLPSSPVGKGSPLSATLGSPPSPARAESPSATGPVGTGTPQSATVGPPPSPMGTGTPPCAISGAPPSPARAGPPRATSPGGMGTPESATFRTPLSPMGTGTPPCAISGAPPSPARPGPPCAISPTGTRSPPCATPGTPPSPVGTGPPPPASPIETGPPTPFAIWKPSSLAGAAPPPSSPRMGGLGTPESTGGAEPLPPSSPPGQTPSGAEEPETLPLPSPPSTPQDEEGPSLDTFPLPSPPAWGFPGLLVGPGEGVPSPSEGSPLPRTPPRSPSPPSPPQDRALPSLAPWETKSGSVGQEPARGHSGGHNGIGGHQPEPSERDPPAGQGEEPSESIVGPQPLHKDKPGFALLLAHSVPPSQLLGGTGTPTEDEDHSPHAL